MPIGIIIVGVGNANFDEMEIFDGDDEPLYSIARNEYSEQDPV